MHHPAGPQCCCLKKQVKARDKITNVHPSVLFVEVRPTTAGSTINKRAPRDVKGFVLGSQKERSASRAQESLINNT